MQASNIKDEWGELNLNNRKIVQDYLQEIQNKNNSNYMITVARDGEDPVRSVIFYDNAIDAVKVYESYEDWGFAKDFLTVTLYEPNSKIHQKILKRPPGIEAVFMRKQYIEMSTILLEAKPFILEKTYQKLVSDIAQLFSVDNKRFDSQRFFYNTECFKENE